MSRRLEVGLVAQLYGALNQRDIETALCVLHDDVVWVNDSTGGLRGHDAFRFYWLEQWKHMRPITRVLDWRQTSEGLSVAVHEVVWALDTNLVDERYFDHVHSFEGALVRRVEIHPWPLDPGGSRIANALEDIPAEDNRARALRRPFRGFSNSGRRM